jgi:hypothetical protein
VLAAGSCRIGLHERVFELAEPRFVSPSELGDLPRALRVAMAALGFRYLVLETVAVAPGKLEAATRSLEPNQATDAVPVASA